MSRSGWAPEEWVRQADRKPLEVVARRREACSCRSRAGRGPGRAGARGPAAMFGRILDRVAEAVPESRRKTLPGAAHAPQLTHPTAYAEAILAFTSKAKATASLR